MSLVAVEVFEEGTFTISEDTTTVTINHSLGHTPRFCFFWCDDLTSAVTEERFVSGVGADIGALVYTTASASKGMYDIFAYQQTDGKLRRLTTSTMYGFTDAYWDSTSIKCLTNNASKYWKIGTYHYIIG